MNRYRFLLVPGYLIGASLTLIPLFDAVMSAMPLRPGDVGWRFGFEGLMSRAIMTPMLGLLIVLVCATAFEHRRVVRVVAILAAVAAASSLILIVFFALDALTLRRQVRPDTLRAFDLASLGAVAKYLWGSIVLTVVAAGSWKNSRARPTREEPAVAIPLQLNERMSQPRLAEGAESAG
jgi:hypothetical protein